jgi:4-amino-4-deoxy-L-arabinose transferase-like glycosyltransferase
LVLFVAIVAAVIGLAAAVYYARLGLTLSHYDARGHLVVARRVIDSLTPGWQQIGAVWLPLPHVLNAIPVQSDALFRTGASAVALSIASLAVAAAAIAWIVARITESQWAAVAAAVVFVMNPNVLYLQATPMTEPMLLGLTLVAVALLIEWCLNQTPDLKVGPTSDAGAGSSRRPDFDVGRMTRVVGVLFALACLTRYEAWPVTTVALAGAVWARYEGVGRTSQVRRMPGLGGPAYVIAAALRDVASIAIYPAAAVLGFIIFSRVVVGEWFVAGGFFVPENPARDRPLAAAGQILTGVRALGGTWITVVGLVGLIGLLGRGVVSRRSAVAVVALSPLAAGALPWLAFVLGHPHRVRYMVPLLAAQAIGVGAAAARWNRATPAAAVVLILIAGIELVPMYGAVPMVVEAQWDLPNAESRRKVTACLEAGYDGTSIMASMDSLGHYMQELSRAGFHVSDFLHEGNGDIWLSAIERARPFAGWVLIDEYAEGGDVLAIRSIENPRLLDGFSRTCEGGGVALYRRR